MKMEIGDLMKGRVSEGKEKHVPEIEISKSHGSDVDDTVSVIIGKEVTHPNTVEHHIVWLELFGVKHDGQVVDLGRAEFGPTFAAPLARFRVNVADFKALFALSYCNIHGLWKNIVEL
jgi:superoxide reductase